MSQIIFLISVLGFTLRSKMRSEDIKKHSEQKHRGSTNEIGRKFTKHGPYTFTLASVLLQSFVET
jgi:hypothetical protein